MSEERPSAAPRPRIQGLSDLIFGLALSIGAIQLVGNPPQNHDQLVTSIIAFAFSFLILLNVWNRYTMTMSAVPVETMRMIRLNMVLLFLVALEPYLFNLLANPAVGSGLDQEVSSYYGLDIGGMNLVLAYFVHILTDEDKKLVPGDSLARLRRSRDAILAVGLLFIVSAVPTFWTIYVDGVRLRIVLWVLSVPAIWFSRFFGKLT